MQTNNALKIGAKTIYQVEATLKEHGISGKILYVSDSIVDKLYGHIVKPQIEAVGRIKEETVEYNTIAYAMNVAERVIATDVSCIVALGGGRVLDVCKYAAYISKCPLMSIPTTLANDGIASPIAVLKRQDNKPKSLVCAMPTMLLLDTELILNSPLQLIKAGIGDTVSNYMALLDWQYACKLGKDTMNGYAYMMSKTSVDALMKTQYDTIDTDFIEVLANSLVLSGLAMGFVGSSRPVSGAEHLFSHALDFYMEKPNLHGIQVALGTVATLKLIGHDYLPILQYFQKFGVEINPEKLGIDEKTFVLCMQNATSMRPGRHTHLHDADTREETLKKLYQDLVEEL